MLDDHASAVEDENTTFDAEKLDENISDDSGSLTQRAAMIRDELLGNNSLEQDSGHASVASSITSADQEGRLSQRGSTSDDHIYLQDDLGSSGIAHSLRHIEMAFEEKTRELESLRQMQQAHGEETEQLQAQIQNEKKEKQTLTAELEELNTFNASLKDELESMKSKMEQKDELLCLSDRICSGLYDTIQNIKTHIQAAEALSPAIRSLSATCSTNTNESDSISVVSTETNGSSLMSSSETCSAPTLVNVSRTPIDELIKEIQARYAE